MALDGLLKKWLGKQGAGERAEYQQFLTELAQALGVPTPGDDGVPPEDFQFEAPVRSEAVYGGRGTKRIDLYKRGCFILEAKQTRDPIATAPEPEVEPGETLYDLFGTPVGFAPAAKPRRRYDRLMEDARFQAQRYALALPEKHQTPPFIIVADIGRAFELYFDFAGNGRGYRAFPDERGYRIALADLASDAPIAGVEADGRQLTAAGTLRAIWTDPASIDPRTRAAKVTRDIARLLSRVAKLLEQGETQDRRANAVGLGLRVEETSAFLMRTLFCMFAEDVGLLPPKSFATFLADAEGRSDLFWRDGLENLWRRMDDPVEANRFWSHGDAVVRYFNGNLFAGAMVFNLAAEGKNILRIAAAQDWRAVEPAIFGTLLEQVLTTADRAKLGAHYTPRAYVDRLVQATVTDVLQRDWDDVREAAEALLEPPRGEEERAIALAAAFHRRLVAIRVLDPACGTGNFLYVAMEALLRLESDVRQFVAALGGELAPAVHPNQFLGLELNPRAAVIAELVLWIGWLRYRLANTPGAIGDPVLPPLTNINGGAHGGVDAVLVRDATGEPDTARPRRPEWPDADFIVGNPPFIGKGSSIREALGDTYLKVLWEANPRVPKSADFVMQWWDRAADILTRPGTRLRRFGFVTTNSITQVFSRRVIEGWLAEVPVLPPPPGERNRPLLPLPKGEREQNKLHLVLAIPDHPWTRVTPDAAAVRIAMTVAAAGPGEGRVIEIVREAKLDTDDPVLEERVTHGRVNADLSVGTDVTRVFPLKANAGLSSNGMLLAGRGFVLSRAEADQLIAADGPAAAQVIKPYRGGSELMRGPRDRYVIDLFGLDEAGARERYPSTYQHLLRSVHQARGKVVERTSTADARDYFARWWQFAKQRGALRSATANLARYIATTETTKHRIFQFVPGDLIPDHMLIAIASDDASILGVLSSNLHTSWSLEAGGTLEDRPRYQKSRIFDPFPFPAFDERSNLVIAVIAEDLDRTRVSILSQQPALTMTGLYNLVTAIRSGTLPPAQEAAATRARAFIVAKLHDDLDQAVADAYGWSEDWRHAPLPPAEIVRRLVALNAARAAEEAAGHVRWLRPDYQRPRFGGGQAA